MFNQFFMSFWSTGTSSIPKISHIRSQQLIFYDRWKASFSILVRLKKVPAYLANIFFNSYSIDSFSSFTLNIMTVVYRFYSFYFSSYFFLNIFNPQSVQRKICIVLACFLFREKLGTTLSKGSLFWVSQTMRASWPPSNTSSSPQKSFYILQDSLSSSKVILLPRYYSILKYPPSLKSEN